MDDTGALVLQYEGRHYFRTLYKKATGSVAIKNGNKNILNFRKHFNTYFIITSCCKFTKHFYCKQSSLQRDLECTRNLVMHTTCIFNTVSYWQTIGCTYKQMHPQEVGCCMPCAESHRNTHCYGPL